MQLPSELAALIGAFAWKGAVVLWLALLFGAERLHPADDRARPEIGGRL